jgi:hypothetical protein
MGHGIEFSLYGPSRAADETKVKAIELHFLFPKLTFRAYV